MEMLMSNYSNPLNIEINEQSELKEKVFSKGGPIITNVREVGAKWHG